MKTFGYKRAERSFVNGYRQQTTGVDAAWETSGSSYDVGAVKQPDGTYMLVADWMMARIKPNEILQQYNVQNVLRRARLMGHQVKQEKQPDGSIRLVVKT
jgi:hypothetical protein